VTRAVRTPSQLEHDLNLTVAPATPTPTFARIVPDESFESEQGLIYELGYRAQPAHRLIVAATTFYNQYLNLSSFEAGAPFPESSPPDPSRLIIPFFIDDRTEGEAYGVELMSDWQAREWWRLNVIYSYLEIDLTAAPGSIDTTVGTEEASPHHQVGLRSTDPERRALSGRPESSRSASSGIE
jgi:iron complex outermembrane recepter protein